MATQAFTIDSSLDADDAFTRLIDLTRVGEWDRGISNARHVDGEPGEVGARYEVTVTGFDGALTQVVYELLEVQRPSHFVMEGSHPTFRAHDTIDVTAGDGSGCSVSYQAELHLGATPSGVTDEILEATFPKVAAIAEAGLRAFLNPDA
jgi:hypothetical protein